MHIFINTYGTYLHVKDEIFELRVPLEDKQTKKIYLAPQKIQGIVVSRGVAISSDAIILALKYQIDIVVLDELGNPLGRFWHSRLGSTTKIRRQQLMLTLSDKGSKYIKEWLARKLKNQYDYLQRLKKKRQAKQEFIDSNAQKIKDLRAKINKTDPAPIEQISDTLRGLEGTAGRIFFKTLSQLLPEHYQFEGRSSRPARDQFNAFLNYGYGVLYSRVEKALMIAGLDPYVGIMHRDDYNHKSLVYDFIEPYRIWVEETVFKLFSTKKVNKAHTGEVTGGMALNKEGKDLLLKFLIDFIDNQKVNYLGKRRTRNDILMLEAINFAQEILHDKSLNINNNIDFLTI